MSLIQKLLKQFVLLHCNIVNNDYKQDSFGQLLDTSSKKCLFLKTFDSEHSYIEVCFTEQNFKPLEIEDKVIITLVTN